MDASARPPAFGRGLAKAGAGSIDRRERGAASISEPETDDTTAFFPGADADDPAAPLRREEALRRAREVELAEQRGRAEAAEAQVAAIRQTLSFELGRAILEARTPRGLLRLPGRLLALRRRQRAKRNAGPPIAIAEMGGAMSFVVAARDRAARDGIAAARGWLLRKPGDRAGKARALIEMALDQLRTDPDQALALGGEALALNPAEPRLWALADALYGAGFVVGPAHIVAGLSAKGQGEGYRRLAADLGRDRRLLEGAAHAPAAGAPLRSGGTVAIVTPRSLPFHEDAAAFRADEVAGVAIASGRGAVIVTPPGYPMARERTLRLPASGEGAASIRLPLTKPDEAALIDTYRRAFAEAEASLVHLVADDRDMARAAAAAAAAAKIPLIVDVGPVDRWLAAADGSERGGAARADLARLARGATVVVTRSPRAAAVLRAAGIEPQLAAPRPREVAPPDPRTLDDLREELAIAADVRLIGCFGPLEPDPGLDALIDAVPADALLLLAGAGPARPAIERHVIAHGVADRFRFVGPLLPGELIPSVALCEAIAFPREREATAASDDGAAAAIALALGVPVLASDAEAAWRGGGETAAVIAPIGHDPASVFRAHERHAVRSTPSALAGLYSPD